MPGGISGARAQIVASDARRAEPRRTRDRPGVLRAVTTRSAGGADAPCARNSPTVPMSVTGFGPGAVVEFRRQARARGELEGHALRQLREAVPRRPAAQPLPRRFDPEPGARAGGGDRRAGTRSRRCAAGSVSPRSIVARCTTGPGLGRNGGRTPASAPTIRLAQLPGARAGRGAHRGWGLAADGNVQERAAGVARAQPFHPRDQELRSRTVNPLSLANSP